MPLNPDLKAKLDTANEHYEALLRAERDRETYRLAERIVNKLDPEESIRRFEKLGRIRLHTVLSWLQNANDYEETKDN